MSKIKVVKDFKLHPRHDFIYVKSDDDSELEMTQGGIIVPHEVQQNKKTQTGTVVAVGPGRFGGDGKRIEMQAREGDKVLFALMIGYPIDFNGDRYYLIKDYDVMAILEEKAEYMEGIPDGATRRERLTAMGIDA